MDVQEISLVLSTLFLAASIYLFFVSRIEARWIYMSFVVGCIGSIVFHVRVVFFDILPERGWYPILMAFQNGCFGTWLVITSLEKFCETKGYKNLKTRIKTTWNRK